MKHVLVTAGTTYGRLDDNKLVGNRIRGIWATKFACWLKSRSYNVILLLPDTFDKASLEKTILESPPLVLVPGEPFPTFKVLYQNGYESYAEQCYALAPKVDCAVMASAVVNWIPQTPIKGKMKTEGYAEGDVINIPFMLAPRVIDRMRKLNPKLTLIGCKMTSGSSKEELMRAAYQTLLKGHCNVVVANDLSNLKVKTLIYPDGRQKVIESFDAMYQELKLVIDDDFYRTEFDMRAQSFDLDKYDAAKVRFDRICEFYRDRFLKRPDGHDRVFGSVAVRIDERNVLVSPREKGTMFTSKDAVVVTEVDREKHIIRTVGGRKATLNAPLLLSAMWCSDAGLVPHFAVIHLHEQNLEWDTYSYAPPGSVRDNDRSIEDFHFNIDGHGCVFVVPKSV
jgi:hypothetical protein